MSRRPKSEHVEPSSATGRLGAIAAPLAFLLVATLLCSVAAIHRGALDGLMAVGDGKSSQGKASNSPALPIHLPPRPN